MKKRIAFVLAAAMILPNGMAFAEEASDPMAVTLISGPEEEDAEPVSLDDIKIGKENEIDGFGKITFTNFEYLNWFRRAGQNDASSGEEADYACLYFDVLNTTLKDKDYYSDIEVKAIYDEVYEYAGWSFQVDYDWAKDIFIPHESDRMFPISPMYTGHYLVGATLPNAVINGKKELKLEIKIEGNEMTYYVRK